MTRAIDIMTERPSTISPKATVATAIRMLEELEIRHLPVVDNSGELVGMLSDRDLRGVMGATEGGVPPQSALVADLMNRDVVDALPDDDLVEVARLIVDNRIGAVPIVDERGLLVGIVSYVDVLRSVIEERSK